MLQATAVVYMRPVYGDTYDLIHYGPRLVTRSCTVPSQFGWTSAARFAYCNSRHSNYQYDPMPLDFCKTRDPFGQVASSVQNDVRGAEDTRINR